MSDTTTQRRIRLALDSFPSWYVKAARISGYEVTRRADVKDQIAMYEHGSRKIYVYDKVGDILRKAIGHELAHGCDDVFGNPHFFSSTPEWIRIHKNQGHFDIPKYSVEPLEYLADQIVKVFIYGPQKMALTNPDEVKFITTWVFPTLQREFGKEN